MLQGDANMLTTNTKLQVENITVELFRESLVNLLVEVGTSKNNPSAVIDPAIVARFNQITQMAKEHSTNSLSESHMLFKIISSYNIAGKKIDQLDYDFVKNSNKEEVFSKLQELYNNIKLFSESLRSPMTSLLFVS